MTLLELLDKTASFFASRDVPSPRLQAELLAAHVLQKKRLALYLEFDRPMSAAELDSLRPLVKRRGDHEPLQHILEQTGFCGLTLRCSPAALIPRPETEMLADLVREHLAPLPPATLADVGTGSGALALALASALPQWQVWASDIDDGALELARANAAAHPQLHVGFFAGHLLDPLPAPPFAVAANLPYLTAAEMAGLPPEVRREPVRALDGGPDGLAVIHALLETLTPATQRLFLETGITHPPLIQQRLQALGWVETRALDDLAGRPRFVIARR